MGKGSAGERALAVLFADAGFVPMRAGGSGGGTDRALPDLFVGNGQEVYALELKMSSEKPIYLDGEEIDALIDFADAFRAHPRVAVKFNIKRGDPAWGDDENPGWYFFHPDELYQTDGDNRRVKKETALAEGTPFADLVR